MSLKAKLEAVIYAAEEPVTLAQLAVSFAQEAIAWQAERDAALEATLEFATPENGGPEPSDSTRELTDLVEVVEGEPENGSSERSGAPESDELAGSDDPELEARRAERRRDREAREILRGILDELIAEYAQDSRGIEIREIAGGFRMGTKPEMHDAVRAFVRSLKPPMKLSLPALETLAVVAYKQPVTAPEVGEIRGVDSAGVLGSLLSRKLIATAGRKQVIGRPILYKTTREFLLRFGLKDLNELPSMEEFEKMAALELNEESLDEQSGEPVEQTGDLFAEAEASSAETPEENSETNTPDALAGASNATDAAVPIPAAESSVEAAEAYAIVERRNAEEVEVEQ